MTRRMARMLAGAVGAVLLCVCTSYGQTLQPCQDNCIQVSVGAPTPTGPYNIGDTLAVPITFQQASGAGVGEIAALALSLDIPGLQLANCDSPDANGITSAIQVPSAVADSYRVVIENTSCTDDPSRPCLCPGSGQQLASHVNIVVFGPKDLPTPGSGPVIIPTLPNGELVSLSLKVAQGAPTSSLLHIFAETDGASAPTKPSFSAYLSVGDTSAVDQTADRGAGVSKVTTTDQTIMITSPVTCCGDKDGSGSVSSAEATQAVLAFGRRDTSLNPAADCNGDGVVSSSEATRVVLNFGRRQCQ